MPGVDGQHGTGTLQAGDGRQDAGKFLIAGYRLGTRPRRFTTDIDDAGTRLNHRSASSDGTGRRAMLTTIGKTVGRDVEDAHNGWMIQRQTCPVGPWRDQPVKHRNGLVPIIGRRQKFIRAVS